MTMILIKFVLPDAQNIYVFLGAWIVRRPLRLHCLQTVIYFLIVVVQIINIILQPAFVVKLTGSLES